MANNFLCHMDASMAERCLRNIARLVSPHGYLFVSGIDLDIRTKVADDLGWNPLQELLEEIHEGDPVHERFLAVQLFRFGAFEQEKTGLETPLRGSFSVGALPASAPKKLCR